MENQLGDLFVKVNWKQVGMGVLAASVGAAAFGAVHYLFLAGQVGATDLIPGVPNGAFFPILLGAIGLVAAFGWAHGMVKDILVAGAAASVGFGIATYAGWIQPGPAAIGARARAPSAAARYPTVPMRAPLPTMANASTGTKMI